MDLTKIWEVHETKEDENNLKQNLSEAAEWKIK